MPKNILVVGANFANKGAQSMLFTVVDELKKHYDDCEIYFAHTQKYDEDKYIIIIIEFAISTDDFVRFFAVFTSKEESIAEIGTMENHPEAVHEIIIGTERRQFIG